MTTTEKLSTERLAEIIAGCDGVTPGPYQVIVTEYPWALEERPRGDEIIPANSGKHIERRVFTVWDHPQSHSPEMVVTGAIGIGMPDGKPVHFVRISAEDAAHIARLDPATVKAMAELAAQALRSAVVDDAAVERAWAAYSNGTIPFPHQVIAMRAAITAALVPGHVAEAGKVGADEAAIEIADAVLAWMVEHDWLDAENEYAATDVIDALNANAGPAALVQS